MSANADYLKLRDLVQERENQRKRPTVFISGALVLDGFENVDFAEKMTNFIDLLVDGLINDQDCNIASAADGVVGCAVMRAVLRNMHTKTHHKREYCPWIQIDFPSSVYEFDDVDDVVRQKELENRWHLYRRAMISCADFAIFIGGSTVNPEGRRIYDDNIQKEYDIAKRKELHIIPVPSTGFVAKDIYHNSMRKFSSIYRYDIELFSLFEELNADNCELSAQIAIILKLIEKLKGKKYEYFK